VFHEVEGTRREDLSGEALALPQTETYAAWPAVLEGINEVIQSCTYPTRQLTIVTDLRKAGWDGVVSPVVRRWSEQGLRVRVVDVGSDEVTNLALEDLVSLDRTILAERGDVAGDRSPPNHARAADRPFSERRTA
jgi:hypothetical protein